MTSDSSLFDALKYRMVTTAAGSRRYYNTAGQLHRDEGPAIVQFDGTVKWFQNGKLHRDAGPAIEYASGIRIWVKQGLRHREDGPAVIWADGRIEWFLQGVEYSSAADFYTALAKVKADTPTHDHDH